MSSDASGFVDPFETVHWRLEPGRTVVLLIDLQNDFLHPEGWYARSGIDIGHMRRVIEPTNELVRAARRSGVPIVWTQHGFRDGRDGGPLFDLRPFFRDGGLRLGTWGFELYGELDVREEDWTVEKNRLSSFYNTKLEVVLRALRAETILIGGVVTNQCVAATGKDALYRDFKPIVVEECTGTTLPHLQAPAIEMMQVGWAEVRSVREAVAELQELAALASA